MGHCDWFNMGYIGLLALLITPCPHTTSIFAKIFKIHFSRKCPPAKIKCYTVAYPEICLVKLMLNAVVYHLMVCAMQCPTNVDLSFQKI